jgi:hypothetical protein
MANAFSVLSLKRNRSASASKESKMSAIFNKLANTFHTSKKRKQLEEYHHQRRSSLSALFDYFRSAEEDHPFANDALFEQNRYKQQKDNRNASLVNLQLEQQPRTLPAVAPISILKPTTANTKHHRHTNSTPVATTARKMKASHIRHYSHVSCISSSNITVNSEDLTAKEFADIAGIRILSEDENDPIDSNACSLINKKICTHCGDEENNIPSLIVTSSNSSHHNNASSILSKSSLYNDMILDEPQIWDNDFWQRPGSSRLAAPSILHELKQNVSLNQDTYIKKGRFEIHLSNNNTTENTAPNKSQQSNTVIEWKRKSRPTATKHQVPA